MKIGILTYHSVYNFGANLQVLSTVEYLKNGGFIPIVINWIPEDLEVMYDRTVPLIQIDAHKKFMNKFLPCSEICRTNQDIVQVIKNQNIRCVIIGSDAVLQHRTLLSRIHIKKNGLQIKEVKSDTQFPNPFWGSFISHLNEKIPIVVMSASSQNTIFKYIRGRLRKRMNFNLKQFNYISVRDNWTHKMIAYLTKGTILPSITPDPVFAYNQNVKNQYSKEYILRKFYLSENYILLSFGDKNSVSKEWLQSFQLLAEKKRFQCVALTTPGGILFDHPFSKVIEMPLCPKEWYGLIKYSSGYIGGNMHPIVVALHNSIPFYSFDSYGILKYKLFVVDKSSKIYDVLSDAGFKKNRISILGKGYKYPTPEEVLLRITNFDIGKCNVFNTLQGERYNNMMKTITNF